MRTMSNGLDYTEWAYKKFWREFALKRKESRGLSLKLLFVIKLKT